MASKKNVKASKLTKPKKTNALCYVYGGVMKSKHTAYFAITDYQDKEGVVEFVKNNFVQFYGSVLSGRYIPCVDAKKALDQVVELAKREKYDMDGHIITASVGNSTTLLKKATNEETAYTFTIDHPDDDHPDDDHPDDEHIEHEEEPATSTQPSDVMNDDEDDDENPDNDPDENGNNSDSDEDVARRKDKNDDDVDNRDVEKKQEVKKPVAKKVGKTSKSPAKKPTVAKQTAVKSAKTPKVKKSR